MEIISTETHFLMWQATLLVGHDNVLIVSTTDVLMQETKKNILNITERPSLINYVFGFLLNGNSYR